MRTVYVRHGFLSRLCGGEVHVACQNCGMRFLSRLCGGEENGRKVMDMTQFLSRLCGGEVLGTVID